LNKSKNKLYFIIKTCVYCIIVSMTELIYLDVFIYIIYKENNHVQLFWSDMFFFQKYHQFSIEITHVTNR